MPSLLSSSTSSGASLMSALFQMPTPRRRRVLLAGLLVGLVLIAVLLWSAPWRQERNLRAASLVQLQRLARREPDNARVFYYLGTRARQAGQAGAAYDAFTHAADLDADDEASWLGAADLAGRLDSGQGEHDLLSLFLSRHPRSALAHAALARFYHRRRVYLTAYREALAAAVLTPRDADAWRVAGSEALLGQSYPEAEAAGRRAVALRPQDWANHVEWGDALMALNRPPEALVCYRQALSLGPGEPVAAASLARALLNGSAADVQEAQALLLRTTRQSPQVTLTYLLLGQSYERQSRWREARAALEEAGRRDPRLNEVHFEMGRVARNLGDAQTAAQEQSLYQRRLTDETQIYALRLRVAQMPDDAGARLTLARLCARDGDRDEAVLQCRQILARRPKFQPARTELDMLMLPPPSSDAALMVRAEGLRAQGRWALAGNLYARVLAHDRLSATAAQGLGLCLIGEGQPGRAFPFLAYSVRLDPRLPEAQAAMAALYRDLGFPDEARKRLNIAVKAAPDRADFWHELGMVEGGGDAYTADAERALARAVALAPMNNIYRLDLAEQEATNGRGEAAEADYRRVAADAPHDADALSRLGGFLLDATPAPARSREAEELLRRALARDPSNTYALYKLGRLALERGDSKGAASALRVVVARSPDIAEAWYSLGMALKRSGDAAEGNRALAESRRLQQAFQERVGVQERIALHPLDPALRLRVARLYAANGENAKALYEYQAGLRLAPASWTARAELAVLSARLRAQGCLPSMSLYAAMAAQMTKAPPPVKP